MITKRKAVIFDLDGTLAFTAADLLGGMNYMLDYRFGFPPMTMEDLMTAVNFCERDYVEAMVKLSISRSGRTDITADDALVDECVRIYSAYYGGHYCVKTTVYDGLREVIVKLKENGIRLAVDTNKKAEHAVGIVAKLLPDLFEIVVGDGMYVHKPDPEGPLKIAEQFGEDPAGILFIGDSDVDMKTAKNAGMIAVGVTWGYRDEETLRRTGADHIVHTPAELLALCGIE